MDKEHKNQHRGCAFVEFQHQVSVNYAIGLLNQISLYGYPMKVSYMTAGNNSGAKSVNQSPTSSRPPPPPSTFNGTSPQNFLSFSDSPITDARQLLPPNSGNRVTSSGGAYYAPPVSSNRDKHYDNPGHSTSHSYPRWLQRDTIRQIHDWREREQERSRQSSHQHHNHGHHSNGYPSSYR